MPELPEGLPKLSLSEAESKWLKMAYEHFLQDFLLDVDRASQWLYERGEWSKGFRPLDIDERLLVDAQRPTLLGVWYADPDSPLLTIAHGILSWIKRRIITFKRTGPIKVADIAAEVGVPPDQLSRALDLIWLAGDLMKEYSYGAQPPHYGVQTPGRLAIYDTIQVDHPVIFEEYEKYESIEKLMVDRYEDPAVEAERRPMPTENTILGRYELMRALVGYKSAIEAKLSRFPFDQNVFIMMKFRESNKDLGDFIKETLESHGLRGVRADDQQWNITNNI